MTVTVGFATAADGAQLSYRADGEGETALVACNGIGVSTFFWRSIAEHFSTSCAFVTWDYRGHGRSPVPARPQDASIAQCAGDLFAVMDALGLERAVLLGHSMGAQVILEAYRQHRDRVQALVPVLGASGKVVPQPALARIVIELGERYAPVFEALLRTGLRTPGLWQVLRALRVVHPDLCPREEFEPYFEHLAGLDLRAYFALARDLLSHDATGLLPSVEVPALVIGGERDLFVPQARSRELAAKIPGAELLMLREGSHAALVEQPELVALTLEKFLRRHQLC
jgi:pimeloyl-ACP methyl ester carboxylesterase